MSKKSNSSPQLVTLLLTGFISLVVGVGSGFFVNYLTEKRLSLIYDITAVQAFPGQIRVGIVAVRISNGGQRELEDVQGTISFPNAELKDVSFQGLTPPASGIQKTDQGVTFQVPFLNPQEQFSVQFLVTPRDQALQTPFVSLRAKGTTGKLEEGGGSKEQKSTLRQLAPLFAGVAVALLLLVTSLKFRSREQFRITEEMFEQDDDDQRDVFSFVLAANGLVEEANIVRQWPRDWSYWSISDFLTERWLASPNKQTIEQGIKSFEQLMSYSIIVESSAAIIHLNSARLALKLENIPLAKQNIEAARKKKSEVVAKRLKLDKQLSNLA